MEAPSHSPASPWGTRWLAGLPRPPGWAGGGVSKKARKAIKAIKAVIYEQARQKLESGNATKLPQRQKLPRQSAKQPARVSQPAS